MLMVGLLSRMPDLRHRVLNQHCSDGQGHCRECGVGVHWPCDLHRIASDAQRMVQPRRSGPGHAPPRFVQQPRQPQHLATQPSRVSALPEPLPMPGSVRQPQFVQPLVPRQRPSFVEARGLGNSFR
jgi:hypothetical protein